MRVLSDLTSHDQLYGDLPNFISSGVAWIHIKVLEGPFGDLCVARLFVISRRYRDLVLSEGLACICPTTFYKRRLLLSYRALLMFSFVAVLLPAIIHELLGAQSQQLSQVCSALFVGLLSSGLPIDGLYSRFNRYSVYLVVAAVIRFVAQLALTIDKPVNPHRHHMLYAK